MLSVNDGSYKIEHKNDGVYLIVTPPKSPAGKAVSDIEVLDDFRRKRIKNYNAALISDIVLKAQNRPIKVAESQQIVKVNSEIIVSTSSDKMKAYVYIKQPEGGGNEPTIDTIVKALKSEGVVFGVKQDILKSLVEYPIYNQEICIAEGIMPRNGKNGEIEYLVDIAKDRKPTILEDGRVDFRDLNIIESVKVGQVLCKLIPPTPAVNGANVFGKELKGIDGKPAFFKKGKNVTESSNGQTLIAQIDGQLMYANEKISVFATYEVPADVDNSTGNINFIGNVTIRGNVLAGFTVEAKGNVEVNGVVEGAIIKADGDIILKRGMQGSGKGQLIAGGDIIAKYLENTNAIANNDIKAEAIMHSDIMCGNKLELAGHKGLLVGGVAKVGKVVEAKVIGSHLATSTQVEVGVDPNLRERYKSAKQELKVLEDNTKKAKQAIDLLTRLKKSNMLTPDKEQILAKSIRSKIVFESKIGEYKADIEQMEIKLQEAANGRVRCSNFIYSGVKIAIGAAVMYVKDKLSNCSLYKDGADIRVGPY